MALDILRKIGLSDGEIRVYGALLDLGAVPLNRIHEKVGIERRNIYDILNKLIERGLVTYITENKRRSFQLADPKALLKYVEEKQENLETLKGELRAELPELTQKFGFERPAIGAEIYRGEEGMKTIWNDMLDYPEIYWIGSGRYVPKKLPHFFASWNRRRIERKIKMYNIFRAELRNEVTIYRLEYARFLPSAFSGNPTVIGIHGNKVVHFLYGETFFAFVIESEELAENYRRYHKYLWDNVAKP